MFLKQINMLSNLYLLPVGQKNNFPISLCLQKQPDSFFVHTKSCDYRVKGRKGYCGGCHINHKC